MKNNKKINIYMGIIGEAYVDKETAYSVLLAAKKNILDVEAIIAAAEALRRPLELSIDNAHEAIEDATQVYNELKDAINSVDTSSVKYAKLFALLAELNLNDFDENPLNGGNIYTAIENLSYANTLEAEINDIKKVAEELLEANKLNAIVRCKEYNIAKEIFESMIPENIVSPEDLSDAMESELLRRINAVRDNIDYVNLVADEISDVSEDVSNRIKSIESGEDELVKITNENIYWYAGNINPYNNELFMINYGFTWDATNETYLYKDADGNDVDFGINGPLKANKWFNHPLHLLEDGELIAGVNGGKAKYDYWYIAVPRYILTNAGLTAYAHDTAEDKPSKFEWAKQWREQYTDEEFANLNEQDKYVDSLYPVRPQNYEHIDDPHDHPTYDNEWDDLNDNNVRDEGDADIYGYEKITDENNYLSINNIAYDVWRCPVTIYNKQRLNVYFAIGKAEQEEQIKALYWYIGTNRPSYKSNPLHDEGWTKIDTVPTKENPITYNEDLDEMIYYIAIPDGLGIYHPDDTTGLNLADLNNETESPYTFVYSTLIGNTKYYIYISANNNGGSQDDPKATFADYIYAKPGANIVIPEEEETPTGETEPVEPTGETEPVEPTGETEPVEPTGETEPDDTYLTPTIAKPTAESIAAINFPSTKPTVKTLNTSEITRPTELYLVLPSAWVTADNNDNITIPVITDTNGFAQGAWVDSKVTVDGVEYTIIGTELGQDTYTITFN